MTSDHKTPERWHVMTDCSGRSLYTRDREAERRAAQRDVWVERAYMALAWALAVAVAVMICCSLVY